MYIFSNLGFGQHLWLLSDLRGEGTNQLINSLGGWFERGAENAIRTTAIVRWGTGDPPLSAHPIPMAQARITAHPPGPQTRGPNKRPFDYYKTQRHINRGTARLSAHGPKGRSPSSPGRALIGGGFGSPVQRHLPAAGAFQPSSLSQPQELPLTHR